jgi:RNA polymerase subunit RPABC4/transcription elongation factor Spt4
MKHQTASAQKECPGCAMEIPSGAKTCPICQYEFPEGHSPMIIITAILLLLVFLYYLAF